ncbi:hypothetical protein [Spirulina sp. 06S082]|uniref:hypothetical protein n=1 Tax=Spirulina sp. 06S082 TaxID=3110248 RepID=UPI002B216149|nr:hypothetical protein [Spirulina sp. 06S082]MEA5470791.1 hypothetical protein [Spirulina sp. 06S082]
MNPSNKPALMRPKSRPQSESKASIPPKSPDSTPKPSSSVPVKPSISVPSKPHKVPRPRKATPILEHDGLKAGDAIALPYSGQTVTITQFYKTISDTWYAAFTGGCVRQEALSSAMVAVEVEEISEA